MIKHYYQNLQNIKDNITIQQLPNNIMLDFPSNYFEEQYKELVEFLNYIYNPDKINKNKYSYQYFYQLIEDLVINNYGKQLYQELSIFYEQIIKQNLQKLQNEQCDYLKKLQNLWLIFSENFELISEIFRTFECKQLYQEKRNKMQLFILNIMENQLLTDHNLLSQLVRDLLFITDSYRNNEDIDEQMLKDLIQMLQQTNLFNSHFQKLFITKSQDYYQEKQQKQLVNYTLKSYLDFCTSFYEQENQQLQNVINNNQTKQQLNTILDKILIKDQLTLLFDNGFSELLREKAQKYLQTIYNLTIKVNDLEHLKQSWSGYIKTHGSELLLLPTPQIIPSVLSFNSNLDQILSECFSSQSSLRTSKQYAFEHFFNQPNPTVTAELLSKQFDIILRQSARWAINEQSQGILQITSLLQLFSFIQAKDVFEAFYSKRLVSRLVTKESVGEDNEQMVISQLAQICGQGYVKKLEDIIKDVQLSINLNQNQDSFYVNVFGSSQWPLPVQEVLYLPPEMQSMLDNFKAYYQNIYKGHLLKFQYEANTFEISYFLNQKYIITASLIQGIILLLFNDTLSITLQEMSTKLQLPLDQINKHLLSFFHLKPINEQILSLSNETVTLNSCFSQKQKKIKLSLLQKKEKKESEETCAKVLQERSFVVESGIVQVMKRKRTVNHQDLVEEVMKKVKLGVGHGEVKKRIEALIDKEYMERDDQDRTVYHYIA